MKNSLFLRIFLVLLCGGSCVCVSETAAQHRRGLFVEPRVQTTQWLGEQALLVGVRVGPDRAEGVSFDVGLDPLATSVFRNPGPYLGDEISRLGRLSGALRYNGSLVGPLRYDVGALSVCSEERRDQVAIFLLPTPNLPLRIPHFEVLTSNSSLRTRLHDQPRRDAVPKQPIGDA